jgi:hypothetical protein
MSFKITSNHIMWRTAGRCLNTLNWHMAATHIAILIAIAVFQAT